MDSLEKVCKQKGHLISSLAADLGYPKHSVTETWLCFRRAKPEGLWPPKAPLLIFSCRVLEAVLYGQISFPSPLFKLRWLFRDLARSRWFFPSRERSAEGEVEIVFAVLLLCHLSLWRVQAYDSCWGRGSLQHPWYHANFDLGSFICPNARKGHVKGGFFLCKASTVTLDQIGNLMEYVF